MENDTDDGAREAKQRAFEQRIADRDSKYKSPSDRASEVLKLLRASEQFTTWDIACFSVEFLASMLVAWDWLDPEIRSLVRKVYTVHYSMDEEGLKAIKSSAVEEQLGEKDVIQPS